MKIGEELRGQRCGCRLVPGKSDKTPPTPQGEDLLVNRRQLFPSPESLLLQEDKFSKPKV